MKTPEEVRAVLHNKKVMLSQNIAARGRVHTEGSETLLNAEIRLLEWVLG